MFGINWWQSSNGKNKIFETAISRIYTTYLLLKNLILIVYLQNSEDVKLSCNFGKSFFNLFFVISNRNKHKFGQVILKFRPAYIGGTCRASKHEWQCFSHRDIQTPRRELKIRTTRRGVFCNDIRGVWMADETLFRVFDISSQLKQKLISNRRRKIVKIYGN